MIKNPKDSRVLMLIEDVDTNLRVDANLTVGI